MDDPTLREATADDSEFAYVTRRAALRQYVEKVWGWDEGEQRQLHEQRYRPQDFRIISVGGEDVGILAFVVMPDCVRVNQVFVLPEHQGRGIGSKCVSSIKAKARQLGLPVRLRALKVNPRARAFYERLGFARIGETDTHVLMEKAWSQDGGRGDGG